jgi:hypothetical protein
MLSSRTNNNGLQKSKSGSQAPVVTAMARALPFLAGAHSGRLRSQWSGRASPKPHLHSSQSF